MNSYQIVRRGRGSIAKVPEITEKLGIRHPLIVGSGYLTGTLLKKVPALLTAPVFSEYHPNPELQDALPAVEIFRREKCDGILSIGGGSAMDTAKAVKAILYAGSAEDALDGGVTASALFSSIGLPQLMGLDARR